MSHLPILQHPNGLFKPTLSIRWFTFMPLHFEYLVLSSNLTSPWTNSNMSAILLLMPRGYDCYICPGKNKNTRAKYALGLFFFGEHMKLPEVVVVTVTTSWNFQEVTAPTEPRRSPAHIRRAAYCDIKKKTRVHISEKKSITQWFWFGVLVW